MKFEREIVKRFQDAGFAAERVPLSGAAGGRYSGDVSVPIGSIDWIFECKKRGQGFKFLYKHLENADGLIIGADREAPLAVMTMDRFLHFMMMEHRRGWKLRYDMAQEGKDAEVS